MIRTLSFHNGMLKAISIEEKAFTLRAGLYKWPWVLLKRGPKKKARFWGRLGYAELVKKADKIHATARLFCFGVGFLIRRAV